MSENQSYATMGKRSIQYKTVVAPQIVSPLQRLLIELGYHHTTEVAETSRILKDVMPYLVIDSHTRQLHVLEDEQAFLAHPYEQVDCFDFLDTLTEFYVTVMGTMSVPVLCDLMREHLDSSHFVKDDNGDEVEQVSLALKMEFTKDRYGYDVKPIYLKITGSYYPLDDGEKQQEQQ